MSSLLELMAHDLSFVLVRSPKWHSNLLVLKQYEFSEGKFEFEVKFLISNIVILFSFKSFDIRKLSIPLLRLKIQLAMKKFRTIFLEEAAEFLEGLTEQARNKVLYNVFKVEGGVKNNDLFKKLEGTNIWEFRTLYNGISIGYLLFGTQSERLSL